MAKGIGWTNIQNRVEFLKGKLDVTIGDQERNFCIHIELYCMNGKKVFIEMIIIW